MMLSLSLKVNSLPTGAVTLGVGSASVNITELLKGLTAGSYSTLAVPLSCFASQDLTNSPTIAEIQADGQLDISLSEIRIIETRSGASCPAK